MNCKNPKCENYTSTAKKYCSEYCQEDNERYYIENRAIKHIFQPAQTHLSEKPGEYTPSNKWGNNGR